MRAVQQQRLAQSEPIWVPRFEDLPDGPMLLVANEFLDALPIRQFVRRGVHWSERLVTLDGEDSLVFVEGPPSPVVRLLIPECLRDGAPQGAVVEICHAALALAAALGARFARQAGAALFIDYGHFSSAPGPTFRALHRHCAVSVLAAPGTADLSAHVDFAAFAEAARAAGAKSHGPMPQARLLAALGAALRTAALRAAALRARATPSQQRALDSGVERLLDPSGMGTLFKAIALISPGLPPPPGFDDGL